MKKLTFPLLVLCMLVSNHETQAQIPVKPAHVILVMEENYAYDEIIGNTLCPVLNKLSTMPYTALFDNYYAIEHPSEPNYLDLFSGENQGVTSDISGQDGSPFTDCNMGASMILKGFTFAGYSEDQPSLGFYDNDDPPYWTKHCPWINWINCANDDSIPVVDDIPYSDINGYEGIAIFPDSTDYASLPTLSWVIPNSIDDMHDNSESSALPAGDNWFHTNMMPLVRWCADSNNNSVLFVTWDEDDGSEGNKVVMMASSGLINGGTYTTTLNHYGWLKTIEDMYGLTECANSATATEFPNAMWKAATGINSISGITSHVNTWPVPAKNELHIGVNLNTADKATITLYDVTGRIVKNENVSFVPGQNNLSINTDDVANGVYLLSIVGEKINAFKKIEIVN